MLNQPTGQIPWLSPWLASAILTITVLSVGVYLVARKSFLDGDTTEDSTRIRSTRRQIWLSICLGRLGSALSGVVVFLAVLEHGLWSLAVLGIVTVVTYRTVQFILNAKKTNGSYLGAVVLFSIVWLLFLERALAGFIAFVAIAPPMYFAMGLMGASGHLVKQTKLEPYKLRMAMANPKR